MVKKHLKNQKDKITTWDDTQSKRTGIGGKSEIFQMLNEEVRFKVSNYWLHSVTGVELVLLSLDYTAFKKKYIVLMKPF